MTNQHPFDDTRAVHYYTTFVLYYATPILHSRTHTGNAQEIER